MKIEWIVATWILLILIGMELTRIAIAIELIASKM